ncbi:MULTISPECIES: AAA family ATPase [Gordonia]|nr:MULTISPECIES: AAA family ATPase [Gordonia]KAF0968363.1 hypothetical protein BPODLACK_03025 [Gordonia sp. YY1]MDJ0451587.1 AAA family ATPase [Gordonia amicalis]MDV7075744.1 AAA family ATPase [Gordonia amicalis]OLT50836.1 hypothetical protein BJF87_16835 [Gordonia sp. CNJ-863]
MSSAYERVIDALRANGSRVEDRGRNDAMAQCPAHDDRNPSLRVSVGRAGDRAVIHCFAGCARAEVVEALGMNMHDLYDDDVEYRYAGGAVVHRRSGKRFSQSGNKADRSLYRVEYLPEDHAQTVYVVEGEKDANTAMDLDGVVAVSPRQGASTRPERYDWSPLKHRPVVVVADRDEKGLEHARRVGDLLEPIATSVVIVQAAEGKDFTDHIQSGHTVAELVPVEEGPDLLAGLISAAELDCKTFADLVEHVPGIITEGSGLIVGPPKAGKSWLMGNIALACASGGRALGTIEVEQRPVLYLALEDGHRRLQYRLRAINGTDPLPKALDILTSVVPGQVIPTIAAWLDQHRGDEPLVILDTLGKARKQRRSGEDAYLADYQTGSELKALVDVVPGACLLAVHHTRKSSGEDFVDSVSGTQGIAGAADFVLVLQRPRKSNEATLAVTGRDIVEREVALVTEDGRWRLDGDSIEAAESQGETRKDRQRLGDLSIDVLEYVNGRGATTPAEVAAEFGVDNKHAGVILSRLYESGRLTKPKRGTYRGVVSVELLNSEPQNPSTFNTYNGYNTTLLGTCSVCGISLPSDLVDTCGGCAS